VHIQSNHNAAELVEIIDMSGNVLDTYSKLPKSIDFSTAENGTYLIRGVSLHGVFVQKVVVQH
jgi:hypothetical protein